MDLGSPSSTYDTVARVRVRVMVRVRIRVRVRVRVITQLRRRDLKMQWNTAF